VASHAPEKVHVQGCPNPVCAFRRPRASRGFRRFLAWLGRFGAVGRARLPTAARMWWCHGSEDWIPTLRRPRFTRRPGALPHRPASGWALAGSLPARRPPVRHPLRRHLPKRSGRRGRGATGSLASSRRCVCPPSRRRAPSSPRFALSSTARTSRDLVTDFSPGPTFASSGSSAARSMPCSLPSRSCGSRATTADPRDPLLPAPRGELLCRRQGPAVSGRVQRGSGDVRLREHAAIIGRLLIGRMRSRSSHAPARPGAPALPRWAPCRLRASRGQHGSSRAALSR
jgi:hypothetical protein